jgi:hypothetical protein
MSVSRHLVPMTSLSRKYTLNCDACTKSMADLYRASIASPKPKSTYSVGCQTDSDSSSDASSVYVNELVSVDCLLAKRRECRKRSADVMKEVEELTKRIKLLVE